MFMIDALSLDKSIDLHSFVCSSFRLLYEVVMDSFHQVPIGQYLLSGNQLPSFLSSRVKDSGPSPYSYIAFSCTLCSVHRIILFYESLLRIIDLWISLCSSDRPPSSCFLLFQRRWISRLHLLYPFDDCIVTFSRLFVNHLYIYFRICLYFLRKADVLARYSSLFRQHAAFRIKTIKKEPCRFCRQDPFLLSSALSFAVLSSFVVRF